MNLLNLSLFVVFIGIALGAPQLQSILPKHLDEAGEDTQNFIHRQNRDGVEYFRCVQNGTIAITFDDGPAPPRTTQVTNALRSLNVPAAFFVCGQLYTNIYDAGAQTALRETVANGHAIGSHTWSHVSLDGVDDNTIVQQMLGVSDALNLILGRTPTVMRPPYGSYNDRVVRIVNGQLGYRLILWSFATNDFNHPGDTAAGVAEYQRALAGTNPSQTPGFIVLHHDPLDGSAELTTASINYARSQGYRFVSLQECLGFNF